MGDYRFAKFHLHSAWDLAYLPAWDDDTSGKPDITLWPGTADTLPHGWAQSPQTRIDGYGGLFLKGPPRCGVTDSHILTWEDAPPEPHQAAYRMLEALGFIAYRRGLPPVQADVVTLDGRTIALCGPPGAGKSTLAAALCERGATLLSAELGLWEEITHGITMAYPGIGALALAPHVQETLVLPDLPSLEPESDKVLYSPTLCTSAKRLRLVIAINPDADALSLRPASETEALTTLPGLYYRPHLSFGLASAPLFNHGVATLKNAPLYILDRPGDLQHLGETVSLIAALIHGLGP